MSHATAPVKKREILGWCCFDFANSAFTTVIITVVYAVYFQNVVANGGRSAPAWWGGALAASQLVVILISPWIGAMADVRANKKSWLMITAMMCSLATASLYGAGPGDIGLALTLVVVANIAFALSENLCAGFLPEISTPATAGRISSYGWSFGYFGGLASLLLALGVIKSGAGRVPWTFVMTGGFFLLASLPTLILLGERAQPKVLPTGQSLMAAAWASNWRLLHELPRHRTLAIFFVALTFFTAGLVSVVAFASVYASEVLQMHQEEIIVLFVVLQVAGVVGAFGFGFLHDRAGAKPALVISLALWIIVCLWAAFCQTKIEFYLIGVLAGIGMGSLQSAGRAVVSALTPPERSGEFFGFWGFFTKLAGVIGQPIFGGMAAVFGFRVAILSNTVFFVIGLLILLRMGRIDQGAPAN
ncbi:MAG: hypothetical protein RLZZ282_1423 [Verrucomicrobiota bacterium]